MRLLPWVVVLVAMVGCGPEAGVDVATLWQPLPSTSLVISQVFGAGGAIGTPSPPPYRTDFVELHNVSGQAVSLGAVTLQYASSMGTNWLVADFDPGAVVAAGGYHLIAFSAGMTTRGAALPTPDTTNPLIDVARVDFKLALVDGIAPLTLTCPLTGAEATRVVDFVGAGSANCFEGARDGGAPAASVTTGLVRKNDGCLDSDVNADDFEALMPVARNAASSIVLCFADGGSSGTPDAGAMTTDAGVDAGRPLIDAGALADAGASMAQDAGGPDAGSTRADAGLVAPDAGGADAGAPDAGTTPALTARSGCRCSSVDASTFFAVLALATLARRGRRRH